MKISVMSVRYAHNEPGAYAAGERYLPPEMTDKDTDRVIED